MAEYVVPDDGAVIASGVGTAPPSPPGAGSLYYDETLDLLMSYDPTRGKWLSVETESFEWGRQGNTAAGSFFQGHDGITFTATNGYEAERDGTIVGIDYTRDDTDAATFEITANGASSGAQLASAAAAGHSTSLDTDFVAGDILGVRNRTGGNIVTDVFGRVQIRWRA